MSNRMSRSVPLENGRDLIITLRSRAEDLAERGYSSAATVAEQASRKAVHAGHEAARRVSKGSRSIARSVRDHMPGHSATGLAALPISRFVRRHPALVLAVGLTAATVGYLAWKAQQDPVDDDNGANEG